jgi:hypothetical protein
MLMVEPFEYLKVAMEAYEQFSLFSQSNPSAKDFLAMDLKLECSLFKIFWITCTAAKYSREQHSHRDMRRGFFQWGRAR